MHPIHRILTGQRATPIGPLLGDRDVGHRIDDAANGGGGPGEHCRARVEAGDLGFRVVRHRRPVNRVLTRLNVYWVSPAARNPVLRASTSEIWRVGCSLTAAFPVASEPKSE